MARAVVIGGGPAGLMAAETLASAGLEVTVAEKMPTMGRKLLMAGKSGLNLTKVEPQVEFDAAYGAMPPALRTALGAFGPDELQSWARELGQEVFTGSSGRVFPTVMKASPLLRAWLAKLEERGVSLRPRWRFAGWDGAAVLFDTPQGRQAVTPDATVLAMGGASWSRLGSDGAWAALLPEAVAPFQPANMGFEIDWSAHMRPHFGAAIKPVALVAGARRVRGEFVISARGLEGGGIYAVSAELRDGAGLALDLAPDLEGETVERRLARPRGKASLSNHLRKTLGFDPARLALLQEFALPLPAAPGPLAALIKALPVPLGPPRPIDEAISTAGGLRFDALDGLMLRERPGVFAAGEMLDWEAPTGGYLLTACLATGRLAGREAAAWAVRRH
ncbi:TIGR03862 family flavoprotein [Limimaricola variabilis]|uniref:TIGR03862 family flavoprotein n=1 Tax=Limimaricola variabilis TaxID=1492771 RepID=UPI002AC9D638|nr:TIGR03862 family flavoprotein [Limimaricola variabilis]WPY96063.1 TIGR03862 family flavoprotein [Limimaricola variabilis]